MLTRMRIWLPDAPGVLGAVAAEIGAVNGNVIGLEVLEREAGVAIDELVVELPDEPGAVEAACRGVRNVPGAGVEEVTELMSEAKDREDTVLAVAVGILQAATATAAMNALTGHLITLFDLTWLGTGGRGARGLRRGVRRRSFRAVGRRVHSRRARCSGADPANDTTGSGASSSPSPRRASSSAVDARRPSGAGSATRSRCS